MTTSEVQNLCMKYHIKNYTINDDMSISVNGNVDLSDKNLKSIPIKFKEVTGYFYCSYNQLTSLKYCPETVGGDFWCSYNQITNFDGLPEFFEQPIYLLGNPVYEIYKLFKRDPRCIYWIREFDAIQGDEVVRDRLEEVFHTLGMDIPKDISLRNYEIINY